MSSLVLGLAVGKGQRRPGATAVRPHRLPILTLPTHSDRLHELAHRVERLATHGRLDPEAVCVAKFTLAAEMRQMAEELR